MFRIRARKQIAGTVKSKMIRMTPLTKRRFAMAKMERTKHARNSEIGIRSDCGETINRITPAIRQIDDQIERFGPFRPSKET